MKVAFLGLGLVGGSVALALRAAPDPWRSATLAAWTPGGAGPAAARRAGVLDAAAPSLEDALDGADIVVLAAPPLACLHLLDEVAAHRSRLAAAAVVTDVASTKAAIVARAADRGLPFVGGHPMAGRETSGYGAASADLFRDRPWVVAPDPHAGVTDDSRVTVVRDLAQACGARVVLLDPVEHDAAVAAISHLPLVLSAALVEAVAGPAGPGDWPLARELAASGWRDMTRLARGDATMGVGILATNGPAVVERVRAVRAVLDAWLAELEAPGGPDEAALAGRLRAARTALAAEGRADT
jgi:prephenate dehydrogenase